MVSEITIKRISQLSGFSISTVSKSLNNRNDVGEKTKLTIQNLAKKLNYVPNSSAVALKRKKTKIIALIVPQIESTFYSRLISEIQKMAFDKGYRVLVLQSLTNEKREFECINNVRDGCVDGIIIFKNSTKNLQNVKEKSRLPRTSSPPIVVQTIHELDIVRNTRSFYIGEKALERLFSRLGKPIGKISLFA